MAMLMAAFAQPMALMLALHYLSAWPSYEDGECSPFSLVRAIPPKPEVINGRTLKYRQKDKGNSVKGIEDDSPPEQLLSRTRKDAQVEE